ncbi:MAG: Gfo/Idh/MocA family oxidoreductase [Anaerolineae bacterium]|nr:Gfo/Idh/MocA family oxidoreductase [Anaerolineae bacterium]
MLTAAIIGCGRIVEEGHLKAFQALQDRVQVVALADPTPERRALIGDALGIPEESRYGDYHDLLDREQPDFVDLALPHFLHEEVTIACAQAGRHILTEKPLTTSLESADRILAAVRQAGVHLGIIHNYRYLPYNISAFQLIGEGKIGDPFFIRSEGLGGGHYRGAAGFDPDWRAKGARSGGGALIDNGYHNMYVAEAMMQSPVKSVYAHVGTYVQHQDVDDLAVVMLEHENNGVTSVQVSWAIRGGGQPVSEVHGTAGSLRITRGGLEIFENEKGEWEPQDTGGRDFKSSFTGLFSDFISALEQGRSPQLDGRAARHNLAIVMAAYESSRRRRPVDLSELGE